MGGKLDVLQPDEQPARRMKSKRNQAFSRADCWLWLLLLLRILVSHTLAHSSAATRDVAIAPIQANQGLYLFTGEQMDPDLGMYYLRARYYQPSIGRFWTMDSYEGRQEESLSLHKYLYGNGNPVNRIDPTGHDSLGALGVASIGATLGGISSALSAKAHGQAITFSGVAQGAALGAFLAYGGWAVEAVGYGLGIGGVLVGGSYLPILNDPGATPGQKAAAATLAAMGAAGGVLTVRGGGSAPQEEAVTLYRAIGKDELLDIATSGELRPSPRSMGDKWFAERPDHAAKWGKVFFNWDKEPVWTLRIRLPRRLADRMRQDSNLDGIGPARSADPALLKELSDAAQMDVLTGNILPQ